jgi:hypothetical protein
MNICISKINNINKKKINYNYNKINIKKMNNNYNSF